ncbi:MAG: GHMP kinase [Chloroflexi bacterium]|nr:GHMP kinase [Chloroflexota bacterium]
MTLATPHRGKLLLGRATACAPGACGELAQGMLDGLPMHVTCPVDWCATATVALHEGTGLVLGAEDCPKARQAVGLTLHYLGRRDVDAALGVASPLPRGKGMASSTADVAAAISATAKALGVLLTPWEIAKLALQVEPTDGLMFPGIALFDHQAGSVYRKLGGAPPLRVLALDFGGMVDTVAFNAMDHRAALEALEPAFREALALIEAGLVTGNTSLIGEGATRSALAHQEVLPKPQLQAVLEFAARVGAAGVNAAHSGTVLGVLLPPDPVLAEAARLEAWRSLPALQAAYALPMVDGGIRWP